MLVVEEAHTATAETTNSIVVLFFFLIQDERGMYKMHNAAKQCKKTSHVLQMSVVIQTVGCIIGRAAPDPNEEESNGEITLIAVRVHHL